MSQPNNYLAEAISALQSNDLEAAVDNISEALWHEPRNTQSMQVFHQILDASEDPLELTSVEQGGSYAKAAVHALALAREHQFNNALSMIIRIATEYDNGFLGWAKQWIDHHPVMTVELISDYSESGLDRALNGYFHKIKDGVDKDSSEYSDAMALCYILGKADDSYSGISPISLHYAKCLRLTKQYDKAVQLAKSYQSLNKKLAALMEGWAYRDKGDVTRAIQAYEKAITIDSSDYSIRLEAGDILLDDGQFERASLMYKAVPSSEGESSWSIPSAMACHYLLTQDAVTYQQLLGYANSGNERAQQLVELFRTYKETFPLPIDLLAGHISSLYENYKDNPEKIRGSEPASFDVALSEPESPSITLCMKNVCNILDGNIKLNMNVKNIPEPDPRKTLSEAIKEGNDPFTDDNRLLWRFQGTDPIPVRPAPSASVAKEIAELASTSNLPQDWKSKASQFSGKEADVYACLVHIPVPVKKDEDPVYWVYKVQQTIAWVLGYIDSGWQNSKRRHYVLGIAHNAMDWPIVAALPVLEDIYRNEPSSREEILSTLKKLEQRMPLGDGHICYRQALYACWSRLPDIALDDRKQAWKKKMASINKPYFVADDSETFSTAEEASDNSTSNAGQANGDVIFPGSPIATVADYVGMMRLMQTGDMAGAMAKYGLDMLGYAQVAQAWGARLAADPALNAQYMKLLMGG